MGTKVDGGRLSLNDRKALSSFIFHWSKQEYWGVVTVGDGIARVYRGPRD